MGRVILLQKDIFNKTKHKLQYINTIANNEYCSHKPTENSWHFQR